MPEMTISSNKVELVHAHQKLQLLTWRSIAVNFWIQISGHLIDLKSCDYAIWGTLEAKIWKHNRFQITTLEDLTEQIIEEWDALPHDIIPRAINTFRKLVHMVIKRNGGHTEKYIQTEKQNFHWFQLLIYSSKRKILDFVYLFFL